MPAATLSSPQVLDERIAELLKRFHQKARVKDTKVANCHGASAYVLGLIPRLKGIEIEDMRDLITGICEGEDKRYRAPHFKKLRRGDLVVWEDFVHTGIVTVPDAHNPTIFSKCGRYFCDESSLRELMSVYGTPGFVRIVRR